MSKRLTKEQIKEIKEQGLRCSEISKKLDRPYCTVRYHYKGGIKYKEKLAKENRFDSYSEYQEHLAKKRGFDSYSEYLEHLAKELGFDSHHEYQKHFIKKRGFDSYSEYLEHFAKKWGFDSFSEYVQFFEEDREFDIFNEFIFLFETEREVMSLPFTLEKNTYFQIVSDLDGNSKNEGEIARDLGRRGVKGKLGKLKKIGIVEEEAETYSLSDYGSKFLDNF